MKYNVYKIKKKRGWRLIMDPAPDLRLMLDIIKRELDKIPLHPAAHGFIEGRSCITNAHPHQQKQMVLNLDIKDFFSSIHLEQIKKCIDIELEECDDWLMYWLPVCFYEDKLATGAPTSPVLSNIYLKELDYILTQAAKELNLSYTRYADDMTFSGDIADKGRPLVDFVQMHLKKFGLTLNRKKIKLMPYYQKQVVTGILVNNKKLSLPRKYKERIFAEVRGKTFESLSPELAGSMEYIRSVDPSFYMKLLKEIEKNG